MELTPNPAVHGTAPHGRRLARPKAAAAYLGLSRSTLYAWVAKRHDMPKQIQLGVRTVVFDLDELDKFIARQEAA